ncbi:prephenate dehydratase [Paenarthrobacter sp. Z7-10]|uniref:prephenate dehydratase n=1 Tax=Paenarthrobacter sp. Z7-10 TaxID=2787635 RepID=UPI0022A91A36|nr:prephenate dehydratase [Paenarthrobacter sp. Z7-10]MCZ2401940.1 prephenate dehydratase [Paenarthrobacter sp. Z7-10]
MTSAHPQAGPTYTFLGPEGTFSEAALLEVPGAAQAHRIPSGSAADALDKVRAGEADAAMLPIENSIEGGVSATLDAIANGQNLRILREVIVPVTFVLLAAEGIGLRDVRRVGTHPHAWAQTRGWVRANMPAVEYVPANSTAAAAYELLASAGSSYQAAICAPIVARHTGLKVLAAGIEDNAGAVTRFVLVGRPGPLPAATGADKTTVAIPLPEDHPGALMQILDQFASRGVNLSRIESRPTGQFLGHYFFSIDADGHISDARMADALSGLHRISPNLRFLGSYPRADAQAPVVEPHTSDDAFQQAQLWVQELLADRSGS